MNSIVSQIEELRSVKAQIESVLDYLEKSTETGSGAHRLSGAIGFVQNLYRNVAQQLQDMQTKAAQPAPATQPSPAAAAEPAPAESQDQQGAA